MVLQVGAIRERIIPGEFQDSELFIWETSSLKLKSFNIYIYIIRETGRPRLRSPCERLPEPGPPRVSPRSRVPPLCRPQGQAQSGRQEVEGLLREEKQAGQKVFTYLGGKLNAL